jgi:linoleoyl-CoA desaturase
LSVQLGNHAHPFFNALSEKVDRYFHQRGLEKTGNWKIYTKAVVLVAMLVANYVLLLTVDNLWIHFTLWSTLGILFAAIGFNLMHDSAHGSFSSKRWVNEITGYSLNLIGGNVFLWKIKHNQIHHVYTNVEGVDDDIDVEPFLRVNEQQKKYWFHRYQFIYWTVLYGFTYFLWVYVKDFNKYFSQKVGETPIRKIPLKEHVIFWISKAAYLFIFLVLPILVLGWLKAFLGYLLMLFVCGWLIAVVFQLAHVVENTHFHLPTRDGNELQSEWAVHQIQTTANFATKNKLVSMLVGGLNFQVEHHLFPRISHIHYPQINEIVRETCKEFGIQYNEYSNVTRAVLSHVRYLKTMGVA